MKIYKYPLFSTDYQSLALPQGARILSAGLDPQGTVCVWALVGPLQPNRTRHLWLIGTGNPVPPVTLEFIGTVVQAPFVWHVFEELE